MSDRPKALVLRAAGTNCEDETARALESSGAEVDVLHVRALLRTPGRLADYRICVIPGGFSYGDDVAAGRVFGLEVARGLGTELRAHVERGGLVLGVCNGFQVLVEAGLFEPDAGGREQRSIALTGNASNRYECRWVELETQDCACPWLVPGERFPVPVAHAEGRFVVREPAVLERLRAARQIALTYVVDGAPGEGYPADPNGSVGHVAGICDPSGRVLGLMPHPERNLTPWNDPHWTRSPRRSEGPGMTFYRRMVETAATTPV